MSTPAARIFARHAGDHDAEWLAEREAREAEHRAELEARRAAFRASDPDLADRIAARLRRR